ncbi:MAG: N-acetylmuramoyl-L-alanine amidase [Cellulosilyticum sp.]|nr:N-acetylmuramoyl-L-alanine amidase [Cellulosilyticum sp.]
MNIEKALLTPNRYSRPGQKLTKMKKIVVHWVGNATSTAKANRNYFESLKDKKIYASAHYIIGLQGEIIQCIPENEIAYHATTANPYSIGIENCHPDWSGKFNEKTYKSLIKLCADICKRYNLNPEQDIIRHYDVSGKVCPKYYVENEAAWNVLKSDVKKQLESLEQEIKDKELKEAVQGIIQFGVILDINVWGDMNTMNMKYAKLMIEKIGKVLGKNTYKETIQYFVDQGCINTPDIWIKERFKPELCRSLLIKINNIIIEHK